MNVRAFVSVNEARNFLSRLPPKDLLDVQAYGAEILVWYRV